jgi:hypothetical protein
MRAVFTTVDTVGHSRIHIARFPGNENDFMIADGYKP